MSGVFEKFQREHDERIINETIQRVFKTTELFKNGKTVNEIAELTGFSVEQIQNITKHIRNE